MRTLIVSALAAAAFLAAGANVRADDYVDPHTWAGYVHEAIQHETRAGQLIAAKKYASAQQELNKAKEALDPVWTSAPMGHERGDLSVGESVTITQIVQSAVYADGAAGNAAKAHDAATAKAKLAAAGVAKQHLLKAIADALGPVKRCFQSKLFYAYAVPKDYSGSYVDVYPHNVPPDAKHIVVTIYDAVTHKPIGAEIFKGQTWTMTVKGFLPDGRFDVRLDLTGTGMGAPNEIRRQLEVHVKYDC